MPAPSETSIANAALTLLGERRIASLSDTSKIAVLLNDRYAEVRDDLLRSHPWNFATKRASLAKDTTAPVWGFDNAFTLPADCLRVLELDNRSKYPYRIEGRKIVTDLGAPLDIEYTARITDPVQMDVMFRQALSAALAADVCEAITGDDEKVETLTRLASRKAAASRVPDGQEPSPRQLEASEWLDAREEQGFVRRVPTGEGTPL